MIAQTIKVLFVEVLTIKVLSIRVLVLSRTEDIPVTKYKTHDRSSPIPLPSLSMLSTSCSAKGLSPRSSIS